MMIVKSGIYYMEDFKFFKEIQLNKYLRLKGVDNLYSNPPELDMVMDIIKDSWCDLLSTGYINNKSLNEKIAIFNTFEIIFPYTSIPYEWQTNIISVDFLTQ